MESKGDPRLKETTRSEHSPQPLRVDGHVDVPYYLMSSGDSRPFRELVRGPFTPDKAIASGVRLFCTALYCQDAFNGKSAIGHFRDVLRVTHQCFTDDEILHSSADLLRLRDETNRLGTILLLENADCLAGNTSYVETLVDEGVRIVSLTHAGQNRLADGNGVTYPDGITREGEEVIRAVADYGLIIDVAHLHPRCFQQVLHRYDGCLIDSHTGSRKRYNITRNLDLEQGKEIRDRKGVIGISFNPEMLSPEGEVPVEEVFAHMDTFVQSLGPAVVGLGSDFFGFERTVQGLEDISQLSTLVDCMVKHGYDEDSIQRILGENWFRLYEEILGVR